jgi:hypothetical protein
VLAREVDPGNPRGAHGFGSEADGAAGGGSTVAAPVIAGAACGVQMVEARPASRERWKPAIRGRRPDSPEVKQTAPLSATAGDSVLSQVVTALLQGRQP